MNRITVVLLACLACPVTGLHAEWADPEAGKPLLRNYGSRELGTSTFNWSVAVDRKGRVYVGNDQLLEYDGRDWKPLPMGNTVLVRAIDLDADGRLWTVASDEFGYFEEKPDGRRQFQSLRSRIPPQVPVGEIWQLHCIGRAVVFTTRERAFVWSSGKITVKELAGNSRIYQARVGRTVWIGQTGKGLWSFDGSTWTDLDLGLPGKPAPQWAVAQPDGSVMLAIGAQIYRYEEGQSLVPLQGGVGERLQKALVSSAVLLPSGETAIGTIREGLLILDQEGRLVRRLGRESGLPSLTITGLNTDSQGGLWVVSTRHVTRVEARRTSSAFDESNGYQAGIARVIGRLRPEDLFVATEEKILTLEAARGPEGSARFAPVKGSERLHFSGLPADHDSYYLSASRALLELTPFGVRTALPLPSEVFRVVRAPAPHRKLFAIEGTRVVEILEHEDRLEEGRTLLQREQACVDLALDAQGLLWLATAREGLIALSSPWDDMPARRDYRTGAELPAGWNSPHFFVLSGRVHAYTGTDIYAMTEGGPRRISLPREPTIVHVEENDQGEGSVWALLQWGSEPARLVQLEGASLQPTLYPAELLRPVGRPFLVLREPKGRFVWISGSDGMVRVDTHHAPADTLPLAPRLISARWRTREDSTPLPLARPISLAFDDNATLELELRPAGVAGGEPLPLEYRVGEDGLWTRFDSPLSLSGLREGRRELQVRAAAGAFPAGPALTYTVEILPPWNRTSWARLLFLFAGGGAIAGLVSWRLRSIRNLNTRLQELVDRRTDELTRATAAKSAFLSTLGHEILNPLNGVVGIAESLRQSRLPDEHAAQVNRLASCAGQLASVVEDVLEHARLESGRVSLRLRSFPLGEPVRGALDLFLAVQSPQAPAFELRAEADVLAQVRVGAPDRIRHILVNYLSNALKFGAGRPVAVVVTLGPGHEVRFAVADQGPGIPEAEVPLLFHRYQRAAHAARQGIPGTGLGLAACKLYAEAMGGEVDVESRPGHGATFWLKLPLRPATAADRLETLVSTDALQRMAVLVVDDHDFNREVLCEALTRLGARPEGAGSLAEAKEKFVARPPDLVLTDFDLGESTGADFARWVRQEAPTGRDVPIIATTAFELPEVRRQCEQAGMQGFLTKPITTWKLREAVARIEWTRTGRSAGLSEQSPAASTMLELLSGGDQQARDTLLQRTKIECRIEGARILQAHRKRDLPLLQRAAHRLVSVAVLLENRELARVAQVLNQANAWSEIAPLIRELQLLLKPLRQNSGSAH